MVDNVAKEVTLCPLCHSKECAGVYRKFYPYIVVRCLSCGFYYLNPRLTEIAMMEIYANDSYFESEKSGYTCYDKQEMALRATFRRLMINLKKHKLTGGALLEVGCGYGYLLAVAKDFFEICVGTDLSPQAINKALEKADGVYEGGIDQVPPHEKFDCIIATHVIEHVYRPKMFLEKLCKHLKPGGKIVIATPNMGSFWRRLMRSHWPSFKIPEHILYFDKKSLTTLMRQVGLAGIRAFPYPHAFPLSLIAEKLHMSFPSALGKFCFWIPATTLAMYGVLSDE